MADTATLEAPGTKEKHNNNIPFTETNANIDDALDGIDKKRKNNEGKNNNEPPPANLGEGEDVETPEQKAAKVVAETKLKADTELAKKHGGEKLDESGNILDATGKIVKTAELLKAEAKPKKPKFWKPKEKEVPAANGEAKPAEEPVTETNFSLDKLPKEIQDRLKRADLLEELINRPSFKTLLMAEESGKDYDTVRNEIEANNPYKKSYEEIYKIKMDREGYSPEEKGRKLAKFMEKDEDDQLDIITPTRKELKTEFDQKIASITPKITEKQPDPQATAWDELNADIPKTIPQYAKELELEFGVAMTPDIIKDITNTAVPLIRIDKETGRIDTKDFLRASHIIRNINLIAQTIEDDARLEVTEEFNKQYNLGLSSESGNHSAQPREAQQHSAKRKEDMKELSEIGGKSV